MRPGCLSKASLPQRKAAAESHCRTEGAEPAGRRPYIEGLVSRPRAVLQFWAQVPRPTPRRPPRFVRGREFREGCVIARAARPLPAQQAVYEAAMTAAARSSSGIAIATAAGSMAAPAARHIFWICVHGLRSGELPARVSLVRDKMPVALRASERRRGIPAGGARARSTRSGPRQRPELRKPAGRRALRNEPGPGAAARPTGAAWLVAAWWRGSAAIAVRRPA